jgi:hypothetical protein
MTWNNNAGLCWGTCDYRHSIINFAWRPFCVESALSLIVEAYQKIVDASWLYWKPDVFQQTIVLKDIPSRIREGYKPELFKIYDAVSCYILIPYFIGGKEYWSIILEPIVYREVVRSMPTNTVDCWPHQLYNNTLSTVNSSNFRKFAPKICTENFHRIIQYK